MMIPNISQKVPLMFRAQINGRCQLQRLIKDQESDAQRWVDEWIDKTYPNPPEFSGDVQTRIYELTWRFVTNGGQDDGVIRPVIGAKGYPFYPGSSMKGLFRQACTPEQADRYCGEDLRRDSFKPGILRFHGGYPTDAHWTDQLLDIVHPQQDWQVKSDSKSSAFVQISLYKPKLQFGISSTVPLEDKEWETIWQIWETALANGIGCRVSAGYGQLMQKPGETLYRTRLKGQGQAAKLIDGTGEFRPNIFRAALRGHALRLFGGLTDAETADQLVEQLFGGVRGQGTVGLLRMLFRESWLELDSFGKGSYEQPTYNVEAELSWLLSQTIDSDQQETLKKLVAALTRFAMILGGFGKSWRRADHRLFYLDYYEEGYKPLIGCHWQWVGDRSLVNDVQVRKLEKVGEYIDKVRQTVEDWMKIQGVNPNPQQSSRWREAWHPDHVQVWGRKADNAEDSEAVHWLHGPYQPAIPNARIPEGSIYRSSMAGQVGQIGRLWHRMYPVVRLVKDPANPNGKPLAKPTHEYFELLTLFPDDSQSASDLLNFLEAQQGRSMGFQKLWGN